MENTRLKITQFLSKTEANIYDIYYILYTDYLKPLENESDIGKVFQIILEESLKKSFLDDGASHYIQKHLEEKIEKDYLNDISDYIDMLIRRNPESNVFYSLIYRQFFMLGLYGETDEEKAILLYLLSEKINKIPYYPVHNLLSMSNEEYKNHFDNLHAEFQKAIYMFNRGFKSKTELVSQLYEIADSISEKTDRIVFWSIMMSIIKNNQES